MPQSELEYVANRVRNEEWVSSDILDAIATKARRDNRARGAADNPVNVYFEAEGIKRRQCDEHGVGVAAMPMRLRRTEH